MKVESSLQPQQLAFSSLLLFLVLLVSTSAFAQTAPSFELPVHSNRAQHDQYVTALASLHAADAEWARLVDQCDPVAADGSSSSNTDSVATLLGRAAKLYGDTVILRSEAAALVKRAEVAETKLGELKMLLASLSCGVAEADFISDGEYNEYGPSAPVPDFVERVAALAETDEALPQPATRGATAPSMEGREVLPNVTVALRKLFIATGGERGNWTNSSGWTGSPNNDPCLDGWYGVTCEVDSGSVLALELPNNGLCGTLPEDGTLAQLEGLLTLDLSSNIALHGVLPRSLPRSLTHLNLQGNLAIQGTLPTQYGKMTNAKNVGLFELKNITGALPTPVVQLYCRSFDL